MRRTLLLLTIALMVVMLMLVAAMAPGLANPNKAGKSGHFHPRSNPCLADPDHPLCPGPH